MMKNVMKVFLFTLVLTGLVNLSVASQYEVSKAHSSVKWVGKKVGGQHSGTVRVKNGSLVLKEKHISSATLIMDMHSLVCEDITDAENNARLVGHLKSDDFFSVEKFPEATFVLTSSKKVKGNEYEFNGNLTIKGITHPVNFKAVVETEKNRVKATGQMVVNRAKYDVRYGSGSFFSGLGDKVIHDNFTLDFLLVATI